jgi:hypothetical protein
VEVFPAHILGVERLEPVELTILLHRNTSFGARGAERPGREITMSTTVAVVILGFALGYLLREAISQVRRRRAREARRRKLHVYAPVEDRLPSSLRDGRVGRGAAREGA